MKNKVIIITGASSGIGFAAADLFAKNGYNVYGISRTVPSRQLNGVVNLVGDVTNTESIEEAFAHVFEKERKVDVVICNAGMGVSGASEFIEKEKAKKQIDINLLGAIETSKVAAKYLKQSGGGKIFFTSSVAAIIPIPFQAGYSATKAGLNLYSQALGMELERFNIKVCSVMPGDTKTAFTSKREKVETEKEYAGVVSKSVKKMEKDEQTGKSPYTVAKVFLRLAKKKSPKPLVCVGFSYKMIAFLAKVLPQRVVNFIVKKMYA